MFSDPLAFLSSIFFLIPAVLIAVPAHEIGHVIAATAMGDPSARNRGYLRPDPAQFFTLYGLLMIVFWNTGWGARAPVNEYRLTGTRGRIIYALGGPAANLGMAIIFGLVVRWLAGQAVYPNFLSLVQPSPLHYLSTIAYAIFFLNLSIFAFNLLPIPGFDGWRIAEALFQRRNPRFFLDVSGRTLQIQQVLLLIVFAGQFVLRGVNLLSVVMLPLYAPAAKLIIGGCAGYFGLSPCPLSAGF